MLMALTQAARVQILHFLVLKNISIGEDCNSVELGGSIKQNRPNFKVQMVKFYAYVKDKRLCVYETLNNYIVKAENLRKTDGKLFISFIKPHKKVSKYTTVRWIKKMLNISDINTKMYTVGSVHPSAALWAKARDVPVSCIMTKAGWLILIETTFAKHYEKVIVLIHR